jgi:hypothetical protein
LVPRFLAPFLLLSALLIAPALAGAAPEDKPGADVHKAFNDLYPVEFRVRVNKAIDSGKRWLIRSQRPDGSWSFLRSHREYPMGATALAVLTLLKCGIPKEHPAVAAAFRYLRTQKMRATYSVGVLLMALDAKYAPARDPFAVEHVDRYGHRATKDPCANEISPEDLAWMKEGVKFLLDNQNADGVWRYPHSGFDTSNTQFALLGLHAATRCGVKVGNRVWLDALRYMLDFQEETGEPVMYKANEVRGRYRFEWIERAVARGFRYVAQSEGPTGSMTAAGMACLIICQNRLWRSRGFDGKLRAETRRGIRDAIAWLQAKFAVTHNPDGRRHWTYYYLYGLERAGILGRYRYLGVHDWYKEGAEFLLGRMHRNGYLETRHGYESTCFALLFLKRATSRMDAPVITPSGSKAGEMPTTAKEGPARTSIVPDPKTESERRIFVARAVKDLESRKPDIAFYATIVLGHLGHLRAVAPLVRTLKLHPDADVRLGAASALGRLKAADAVPTLIGALNDEDELVCHAAEAALTAITRHRLKTRISRSDSRNERVRRQKEWRAYWAAREDEVRARLKQPRGS